MGLAQREAERHRVRGVLGTEALENRPCGLHGWSLPKRVGNTLKSSKSEVQVPSRVCMTWSHCTSRCFIWLSFGRIMRGGDEVDAESLLRGSWGCPRRDDGGLNNSSGSVMGLTGQS